MNHQRLRRYKTLIGTTALVVAELGCQRPGVGANATDPVLAFVAEISSNSPDASPSKYTLFFSSGRVVRFSSEEDLREAWLSTSRIIELRDTVTTMELGVLPEVNDAPPDAAHIVLAIRKDGRLKRYAWTGRERPLGPPVSASEKVFIDAWRKAHSALQQATPDAWASVSTGKGTMEQLWTEIHGQ